MAREPFVTINAGEVKAQVEKINRELDNLQDRVAAATQQALVEAAEIMLAEAQAAIHSRSGELEASGTVLPAEVNGSEISVRWGFNKEYARIQDQGGTVLPVHAKMLAIPLEPVMTATGPRFSSPREDPGSAGNGLFVVSLWGKLYLAEHVGGRGAADRIQFRWLLLPSATLKGNGYVTKTAKQMEQLLPELISNRVAQILAAGSPT